MFCVCFYNQFISQKRMIRQFCICYISVCICIWPYLCICIFMFNHDSKLILLPLFLSEPLLEKMLNTVHSPRSEKRLTLFLSFSFGISYDHKCICIWYWCKWYCCWFIAPALRKQSTLEWSHFKSGWGWNWLSFFFTTQSINSSCTSSLNWFDFCLLGIHF